ncbi:prenyltransferase [Leeia sp. TBRC 13508]|uniref:Prenyltransferase n=1 Tax=Leeia speluncae TaxID=2884804 RepID=A0ABS8D5G2_9NEIS|nr:prenyltransferase [Leeia speluncae]MCB6183238.1 prenyltransferase [Leeia speluncae]
MPNKLSTHFLASRPQFFSLSLVGMLLGIASQSQTYVWWLNALAILCVLFVHAGANLINDVADEENGTDRINEERITPFTGGSRFIQDQLLHIKEIRFSAYLCFGVAAVLGLIICSQRPQLVGIGLVGMVLAWGYSAKPLQLNSRGLGEIALFLSFGAIPFGFSLLSTSATPANLCLAAYYGLQATAVLFLNQYPDRKADQQAGKHHLVVRMGAGKATLLYLLMIQICFMLLLAIASLSGNWLTISAALPLILQLWCLLTLWKIKGNTAEMKPLIVANIAAAHIGTVLLAASFSLINGIK